MSNRTVSVYAEALKRQQEEEKPQAPQKAALETTQEPARKRDTVRDYLHDQPRGKPRNLPTREEIQEFSFRLRDELKVKVQAQVPHKWQKELGEIARELEVNRLELYRLILGEFLGKVSRKETA